MRRRVLDYCGSCQADAVSCLDISLITPKSAEMNLELSAEEAGTCELICQFSRGHYACSWFAGKLVGPYMGTNVESENLTLEEIECKNHMNT